MYIPREQFFDASRPLWVGYAFAREAIQSGWIGQYMADSVISRLIRYSTQGVHSHSAMFVKNGGGAVDVLELREFRGGQRRTLEYHFRLPSRIDVFAPDTDRWPEFDGEGAVRAMRRLTDYAYGWLGIWRMAARRIPLVWRLYPPTVDDRLPDDGKPIRQPFCSHAVSLATHLGGGVDPVPRLPHYLVAPAHLTWSLFYRYQFSLAGEWAIRRYGDQILEEAAINEERLRGD